MKFLYNTLLFLVLSASLAFGAPGDIYINQDSAINYLVQKRLKMPDMVTDQSSLPVVAHYSVTAAQIAAIGAATSGDITLATLPAKTQILTSTLKHSAAIVGTSISAATGRIITVNNNRGTAFNVFQAPGNTVLDFDPVPTSESYAAATVLKLHMTSTGANLSAVTAGAIDCWVVYYVLP